MYLVTKDGRERFLGFLRNLGSQAILLTAFSIVLVTLDSAVDAAQRYVLATVMIFTAITLALAAITNITDFGSYAFHKDRRGEAGKVRYFVELMIILLAMMGAHFAVVIAVAATVSNINIR